ncbi:Predicted methyltransferase [Ceraceosorus bombacis]|uniref:Predicted methyltransferase n=1 Tax=Ceraceosorus bombacis TaxID=401625 RepID=A0A0P1BN13_9BASI|nr:Predicted methyltransferase [Ceraceosorus bombacis]
MGSTFAKHCTSSITQLLKIRTSSSIQSQACGARIHSSSRSAERYVSRLSRALADLTQHLQSNGSTAQEAHEEAKQLFKWVRSEHHQRNLAPRDNYRTTLRALHRLKNGEPIAYVLGNAPFGAIKVECKAPVLIPRHETEEWTLRLGDLLKAHVKDHRRVFDMSLLDLCTGTGCIALLLADIFFKLRNDNKILLEAHIRAVDVAPQAVALAERNANRCKSDWHECVDLQILKGDLFVDDDVDKVCHSLPAQHIQGFDLLVCNPPYISASDWKELDASVKNWEDRLALVGDYPNQRLPAHAMPEPHIRSGLIFYKRLAQLISSGRLVRPPRDRQSPLPSFVLEVGHDQASAVVELFAGCTRSLQVWRDAFGKDRAVVGWLN